MTLPSTLSMISLPSLQHPLTPHQPATTSALRSTFFKRLDHFSKPLGSLVPQEKQRTLQAVLLEPAGWVGAEGWFFQESWRTVQRTIQPCRSLPSPSPALLLLCEHYLLTFCSSFKTLFSSSRWGLTVGTVVSSYLHFQSTLNPLVCGKYTFCCSLYMFSPQKTWNSLKRLDTSLGFVFLHRTM